MILGLFLGILQKKMFLSFVNYFPILCFPDACHMAREGPNITLYATDLMVCAKKILGHKGRCDKSINHHQIFLTVHNIPDLTKIKEKRKFTKSL